MKLLIMVIDKRLNLDIVINIWLLGLITLSILFYLGYSLKSRHLFKKTFEIDEAEIGIGNQKIKIRPNVQDAQIAYKLWVELSTRKIGLLIDFDNDVIVEIYNSWYQFFELTRELIKEIPISKVRGNESYKDNPKYSY